MSAPAAEPRLTKGERTKRRILDTLLGQLSEEGSGSLSLRDIAVRCEVTHVTLLHHFSSKEQLFAAVLEYRDELDAQRIRQMLDSGADVSAILLSIHERNLTTPGTVALFAKLSGDATDPKHPAHESFVRRYAGLREFLTGRFRDYYAEHRIVPPVDPSVAAVQTIAVLDGLQLQHSLDATSFDSAAALRQFLSTLGLQP